MFDKYDSLVVKELSKDFKLHLNEKRELHGCQNVSFTLAEGEFMGIIGPSGAGKSTIAKCIYRTYLPSSGTICYRTKDGREIDLATASEREIIKLRQREIGYVSQFLKVIPRVSARDILAEELIQRGFDAEEAQERAGEYLRMMNISRTLWDTPPKTFSGGEQQRINVAKALISQPRLLLLDEPTASLDNETKKIVMQALMQLKKQGTTIIGIFHDTEVMKNLVDRVFTMKASKCKSIKRMQEVV